MTASLRVRPLANRDLPQVHEWMRGSAEAPRWSKSDIVALVEEAPASGRIRMAWGAVETTTDSDADQLCGFAVATALRAPGLTSACELEFLFTAPHARRRGVARLLLGTLIAWCASVGGDELLLEVRRSNNAAQDLYRHAGFVTAGVRPAYYRDPVDDAVLMQRALSSPSLGAPYNAR